MAITRDNRYRSTAHLVSRTGNLVVSVQGRLDSILIQALHELAKA